MHLPALLSVLVFDAAKIQRHAVRSWQLREGGADLQPFDFKIYLLEKGLDPNILNFAAGPYLCNGLNQNPRSKHLGIWENVVMDQNFAAPVYPQKFISNV